MTWDGDSPNACQPMPATVCPLQYVTLLDILPQLEKEADMANKQVYELLQSEVTNKAESGVSDDYIAGLIKIQHWPLTGP